MTSPSFDSRESTTLSPRWVQYGHFMKVSNHKAQGSASAFSRAWRLESCAFPGGGSCGMPWLCLVGEPPHAADVQPFLGGEEQPEQQRRADRKQVEHDRCAHRRIVGRAEKRDDAVAEGR